MNKIFIFISIVFSQVSHSADFTSWKYKGDFSIITTAQGANLPADVKELNVPVLIRLNKEIFNFSQAHPKGADIRFSIAGQPLKYSLESWEESKGEALVWVLIPQILGDKIQTLTMYWGNKGVKSKSSPEELFGEKNNYFTVNHMGANQDLLKKITFNLKGTKLVDGLVGKCREFSQGDVMSTPKNITFFPKKNEHHSTSFWFKPKGKGGDVMGWGSGSRQGKIVMQLKTPGPHINVDAWFSRGNIKTKENLSLNEWIHITHTYSDKETVIYVNGELHTKKGSRGTPMNILEKSKMAIGGWGREPLFEGQIDEVRLSNIARSATWVKLQYENLRPMHTLVGHLKQKGNDFSISKNSIVINEGDKTSVTARAGGADKVYWLVLSDGHEKVVAVDTLKYSFDAGRVSKDENRKLIFRAVYGSELKEKSIPIIIKEKIPDPAFSLKVPSSWDGRSRLEIVPDITNFSKLKSFNASTISYDWEISQIAVTKKNESSKLVLTRAHKSGSLKVKLSLSNGGNSVSEEAVIQVKEPESDPWSYRKPDKNEKPQDGQFYARNPKGFGLMYFNGIAPAGSKSISLKVFIDEKVYKNLNQKIKEDNSYSFKVELKPGLVKYRVELVSQGKVLYKASDIVCGDAYLIEGQSNALATDIREKSPQLTNDWVRSYAMRRYFKEDEDQNLWCKPVWKAGREYKAELGWWGMDLANRLVKKHKIPIFILNAAKGGTRIDQHQRNPENPEDEKSIYGRMLWRLRQAKLTHNIQAVIWHQGESDQGSAGPDGELGWKSYQQYFIDMVSAWKEDMPNLKNYYVFQIRPNACSMGGGNGDMLREKQRTLPNLFANLNMLSTLGIHPPGGCHYPFEGWSVFANMLHPLIARDFYAETADKTLTAANLKRAYFSNSSKNEITLEFDQEVVWKDLLVFDFYLDDKKDMVNVGKSSGNKLILTLKESTNAKMISYIKEMSWKPDRLLIGKNGLAALSFCKVPISDKE